MKEYKNILIVRTDRIGDVVLTVPAIRALKQQYPKAKMTVLLAPLTADLIKGLPFVDDIIVDERSGAHKGFSGFIRLIQTIKDKSFDLAVVYHTKKRTNLACFLARIPNRIGYKDNKYGFLLKQPVVDDRHLGEKHEVQYCLDLLKNINVFSEDLTLELPIQKNHQKQLDEYLLNKKVRGIDQLFLIHPSASDPAKQWPALNFSQLVNEISLKNKKYQFMIIGTKDSKILARDIIESSQADIVDSTGELSLKQLVLLMDQAHMLISNDSGPVHIAAACQTPVISIFTRNQPGINPQRWQPLGEKSRYVSVSPEAQLSFKKAQKYDPQKMQHIAVRDVLEAVDSLSKLC